MKRSIYIPIIIILIIAVIVIAYIVYQRMNSSEALHEQKTIPAASVTSMKIDTTAPDVEITPGEQSDIVVTLDGDISPRLKGKYTFDVTADQNVMNVQLATDNNSLGIKLDEISDLKLKITVPQKEWDQIQVTTTSGDITLHNLAANMLQAQTSSGEQHVSGLKISGTATIKTTSGDIDAQQNEINTAQWETTSGVIQSQQLSGQSAALQTSSGAIKYTQAQPLPNVELTTSSGDVDAVLKGSTDSLQLQFTSSSGTADIGVDGMLYKDKSEHSALGVKGEGDPQQRITVNTSSGDLKVSQ